MTAWAWPWAEKLAAALAEDALNTRCGGPATVPVVARQAVLALDVGTSSCRASLYDRRGRRLTGAQAQLTYAPRVTADGGAELDPDVLFDQVCQTLDAVLEQQPDVTICAVGTSTFWHSLLGVDKQGAPLTPLYLWLDARSRAEAARAGVTGSG